MTINKPFWATFTISTLTLWLLGLGEYYYGTLSYLWANDLTHISFLIILLSIISFILALVKSYQHNTPNELMWFLSDAVLTLGMVGTCIGMILVFAGAFTQIDASNTQSVASALLQLASGLSTALLTTLAGLISSTIQKLNLVVSYYEEV